jgi:hypothetical protein
MNGKSNPPGIRTDGSARFLDVVYGRTICAILSSMIFAAISSRFFIVKVIEGYAAFTSATISPTTSANALPTQLSPHQLEGLGNVITEALVREFTIHSRPSVKFVHFTTLNSRTEITVRIFGDLYISQVIEEREIAAARDVRPVLDSAIRNIVSSIVVQGVTEGLRDGPFNASAVLRSRRRQQRRGR